MASKEDPLNRGVGSSRRIGLVRFIALWAILAGLAALLAIDWTERSPASVRLKVVGFTTNESRIRAVVRLTNESSRTIEYAGYGTNSPVYELRTPLHDSSGWRCGFGLQQLSLKGGEGIQFEIPAFEEWAGAQIVFKYRVPTFTDRLKLWLPHWAARWLPDAREYGVATERLTWAGKE